MLTQLIFMEASEDQSLSLSQSLEGKACLVIIYGIPASGKTLLTTKTLRYIRKTQEEQRLLKWNLFAIHFDDFYPPDMRSKIQVRFQYTLPWMHVVYPFAPGAPLSPLFPCILFILPYYLHCLFPPFPGAL